MAGGRARSVPISGRAHPPVITRPASRARALESTGGKVWRSSAVRCGPTRRSCCPGVVRLLRRDRLLLWAPRLQTGRRWLALTEGADRIWPRRLLLLDSIVVLIVALAATRSRWRLCCSARSPSRTSGSSPEIGNIGRARIDPRATPISPAHTQTTSTTWSTCRRARGDEIQRDRRGSGSSSSTTWRVPENDQPHTLSGSTSGSARALHGYEVVFGLRSHSANPFPVRPLEDLDPISARFDPENRRALVVHPNDTPDTRTEYARIRAASSGIFSAPRPDQPRGAASLAARRSPRARRVTRAPRFILLSVRARRCPCPATPMTADRARQLLPHLERPNAYMHVASTLIFRGGPLRQPTARRRGGREAADGVGPAPHPALPAEARVGADPRPPVLGGRSQLQHRLPHCHTAVASRHRGEPARLSVASCSSTRSSAAPLGDGWSGGATASPSFQCTTA